MTGGKKPQKLQLIAKGGKAKQEFGTGGTLECPFNPSQFDVSSQVNYGPLKSTGSGASSQQFIDVEADTLSIELFFDTSQERADVRTEYIDHIDKLLGPDSEEHAPPLVKVVWPNTLSFDALLTKADKSFTMFLPDGTPVRATVNCTFKEVKPSDYRDEVKAESTDKSKSRVLTEGDTLWLVAAEEYEDPNHWRTIAEANDIDNPREVPPGTELELPPL